MVEEGTVEPLSHADLARVLSPLLLFLAHLLYLAFWSPDPFLMKWIDGSFSFFLALVLCNLIRARVVAAATSSGSAAGDGRDSPAASDTGDIAGDGASGGVSGPPDAGQSTH